MQISVERPGGAVQNAKDTFYEVLRGRLAALNPERTTVVRSVTRPGVVVDENELQVSGLLPDCFHVQWTSETVDTQGALPSVVMDCQISYFTAGTAVHGGMDRGRALAAMDGELLAAVSQAPQNVVKSNYGGLASGGSPVAMETRIWWGDAVFGAAKVERERVLRTAVIEVMSYEEAGEL